MEIELDEVRTVLAEPLMPLTKELAVLLEGQGRLALLRAVGSRMEANLSRRAGKTLWALKKQVIYEHVLEHAPLDPVQAVLEAVPTGGTADEAQDSDWPMVLRLARHCVRPEEENSGGTKDLNPRHVNVAQAALRLRQRGISVEARAGEIVIADDRAAGEMLRRAVARLHGISVLTSLLAGLEKRLEPDLRRYRPVIPRLTQVMRPRPPTAPLGYLINCAIRGLEGSGENLNDEEAKPVWAEIVNLATDLATVTDVEPYTIYERMLFDPTAVLDILRRQIAFDTYFGFPQISPYHMLSVIEHVFCDFTDEECRRAWGGSSEEVRKLCGLIVSKSPSPRALSVPGLILEAGLPPSVGNAVLAGLTHPRGTANSDYLLPWDRATFLDRPLIDLGGEGVLLLDPYLCAPAFYEALAQALRAAGVPGVDRRIGPGVERLVLESMCSRGLTVHHGKYLESGTSKELECDCVIETDQEILIIELKKRGLRSEARRGDTFKVVMDLTAGLLKAHGQSLRHELHLRRTGKLELPTGTIDLKGRVVERVAVTLTEYGSLHDRDAARNFLRAILAAEFSTAPPHDAQLEELRRLQGSLRAGIAELDTLGANHPERLLPVAFLSIAQLLTLLGDSTSNEEFGAALRATRHVTTGSGDMLGDYKYLRDLKHKQ